MSFGQDRSAEAEDAKARRKAEELYRNQKAQTEARKAALLKKQRQILECQEQIRRMDRYAEKSLLEGQEEKAGLYLERKVQWQEQLARLIEDAGITVTNTPSPESCQEPCRENAGGADKVVCEDSCQEPLKE